MQNLNFYNVSITKSDNSNQVVVKGDIENNSGRNYNAVAIRIILFIRSIPITSTVVVVNGLMNGRTKSFDKYVEDLEFDKVGKDITRYEIYAESAY